MTIIKTHSVFCDRCPDWIAEVTDSQGGTKEARSIARAAGWKRVNGEDVCPRCQAEARGGEHELKADKA